MGVGGQLELVTLASDELAVTVVPSAGARLHSLAAFGVELLRTPPDPATHLADPFFWGAYHMLPWCNRIDTGPVGALQRRMSLESNFPDGTAIHGRHYVAPWEPVGPAEFATQGGGDATGWPWTYTARVGYTVDRATLTIDYALTNTADDPMPAGLGFHPWFVVPDLVHIPSSSVFPDNTDTAAHPEPVSGALDLRGGAYLQPGIDATWVDLERPELAVDWTTPGIRLTIAADRADVVVPAANLVGTDAVAVELQTHAPGGIRRLLAGEPYALAELAPGDTLALAISLTFARLAP